MTRFVWFEYVSKDVAKAQGFFGELFNWKTQNVPMPDHPYEMIAVGERTIGGYLPTPTGAPPHAHWLTHLRVDDIAAASSKVVSLGGKVAKAAFQVGEFGHMAIVLDPTGAGFALWQPKQAQPEAAPAEHTFCWNELASPDPDKVVAFYQAIGNFDHEAQDMPGMGTYHVLSSDGQPRCGIMKQMMPEQPNAWLPYVSVASADHTSARAEKLGGKIVVPPTDIPNVGRFSIIVDSQGAPTGLLQPAAS